MLWNIYNFEFLKSLIKFSALKVLQKQERFGPIFFAQEVNKYLNPVDTPKDIPFGL